MVAREYVQIAVPQNPPLRSRKNTTFLSRVHSDVIEPNWNGLVFEELTNRQAVMHYGRHRLTASVIMWLSARTRQAMTNRFDLFVHWSVPQKTKTELNWTDVQFSSFILRRSVRAFRRTPNWKLEWVHLTLFFILFAILV